MSHGRIVPNGSGLRPAIASTLVRRSIEEVCPWDQEESSKACREKTV